MDNLPEFETPATSTEPKPPKKPRQKPTKRRKRKPVKVAAPKRVPIKRRKRRVAKSVETHAGGKFTPEFYRVLGALMELESPLRSSVIEIAKGLSK